MINLVKNPDLVAIFLNSEQKIEFEKNSFPMTLLEIFTSKCEKLFPNIKKFINININNFIFIESYIELDFLYKVASNLSASESDDKDIDEIYLAYFSGLSPLVDINLSKILIEKHKRYLSQYSFSENLPPGIVPTLISREFISTIPDNLNTRFHDFLIKNINNYDTEIYYESPDLRNYRLDFTLNSKRSIDITLDLLKINNDLDYKSILPELKKNPSLFRSGPSYIEVELYRGCDYSCTFCPRNSLSKDRDGEYITKIYLKNVYNQLNLISNKYTICFGGMGEPLHHPEFTDILNVSILDDNISEIIIETALYTNLDNLVQFLENLNQEDRKKLTFIINISTIKEESYKSLYPNSKQTLNELLNKIYTLKKILGKNSIYVQILKIQEIETQIEDYFNFFENQDIQIILQKYNSYANTLPEKRVSDLTPINRDFCWHLARDLYIQSNGNVSACKQVEDVILGNIKKDSINQIWINNSERFSKSFLTYTCGDLPCTSCDEWYTFNG